MLNNFKVRNREGRLLCTLYHSENGNWQVHIKDHKHYSVLGLFADGMFSITEIAPDKLADPSFKNRSQSFKLLT